MGVRVRGGKGGIVILEKINPLPPLSKKHDKDTHAHIAKERERERGGADIQRERERERERERDGGMEVKRD